MITNEKMLRLRYETREEEEVCEGALHRPHRPTLPRRKPPPREPSSSATPLDPALALQRPHPPTIPRREPPPAEPSSLRTVLDPALIWAAHLCRGESPPPPQPFMVMAHRWTTAAMEATTTHMGKTLSARCPCLGAALYHPRRSPTLPFRHPMNRALTRQWVRVDTSGGRDNGIQRGRRGGGR
jgi:hypothetical protein